MCKCHIIRPRHTHDCVYYMYFCDGSDLNTHPSAGIEPGNCILHTRMYDSHFEGEKTIIYYLLILSAGEEEEEEEEEEAMQSFRL